MVLVQRAPSRINQATLEEVGELFQQHPVRLLKQTSSKAAAEENTGGVPSGVR
jgi:hypothetical protein